MQTPTNNQEDPGKENPTEDIKPEVVKTPDVKPSGQIPQEPSIQEPAPKVRTPRLVHSPEDYSSITKDAPADKITVRPDFQREQAQTQTDGAQKSSVLKHIRTLHGDTSEFIRKGKLSMTDLFLKQQRQARASGVREIRQVKPFYKKGGFLIGLLVLILVGAGGGYSLWYIKQEPENVDVYIPTPPKPLIISQETIIVETSEQESPVGLKDRLQSLFHKRYDAGDLVYIPIQKETVGGYLFLNSKLFLEAIDANAPTFLTTFLENNFYLGALVLKKNHPVFILKTQKQQRDNTYAGMLRWEKDILENLGFISNKNNISTSTPSVFEDILIKNYSARAIQNQNGTVLMYGFFNREYIIITDDTEAFEEIIERFILFEFS